MTSPKRIQPKFISSLYAKRIIAILSLAFAPITIFLVSIGAIEQDYPFMVTALSSVLVFFILITLVVYTIFKGITKSTSFELTPEYIKKSVTFINDSEKKIFFKNIKEVSYVKGFLQKPFGLGTIYLHSHASTTGNHAVGLKIMDISEVDEIYQQISELINQ